MWFTKFVKNITKSPLKVIKGIAKYGGRAILRRTGVFGIYGSIKKYQKLYKTKQMSKIKAFGKIVKSTAKKNFLRMLGPANYLRDWHKHGVKYTLKKFGWNKLVPMQIKKIIYFNQNFKSIFGREDILKESKKEIWKRLGRNNHYNTDLWKLNQIEAIMKTPENDRERKDVKKLLNQQFYFRLKSPKTGNFSVRQCAWNPATGLFKGWIRSASGKTYGPYTDTLDIDMIRIMIKSGNYGRNIYWVYFKH